MKGIPNRQNLLHTKKGGPIHARTRKRLRTPGPPKPKGPLPKGTGGVPPRQGPPRRRR